MITPDEYLDLLSAMNKQASYQMPLSPGKEELITCLYGVSKDQEEIPEIEEPPSPQTCYKRAAANIKKLAAKGFPVLDDKDSDFSQIYKISLVPLTTQSHQTKETGYGTTDPFLSVWLSSSVVTSAWNELLSIPYRKPNTAQFVANKFRESAASIAKIMEHDNNPNKAKSRKAEIEIIKQFFLDIEKLRKQMIGNQITDGNVIVENMTPKQKEEFKHLINPVKKEERIVVHQTNQTDEMIQTMFERDIEGTCELPDIYKPTTLDITEKSRERSRLLLENVLRDSQAILRAPKNISRKSISKPKETFIVKHEEAKKSDKKRSEVTSYYWKMFDPLKGKREGNADIDPLAALAQISRPIHQDKLEWKRSLPFELTKEEVITESTAVKLTDSSWTTGVEKTHTSSRRNENIMPIQSHYATSDASRDDISFLMKQTFSLNNYNESETHDKLEMVWDKLGFSIRQKLAMVLKYSNSLEEGTRLEESLGMWTQVLDVYQMYQKAYRDLKDFLVHSPDHDEQTFSSYFKDYVMAEDSLKQIADRLKQAFSDDLIIKRKPYKIVLDKRKNRIFRLKARNGIN